MKRRTLIKSAVSAASAGLLSPLAGTAENIGRNEMTTRHENPDADEKKNNSGMKVQRLAWAGIKIELDTTTLFIDATSYEEYKDMKLEAATENKHALITHHHSSLPGCSMLQPFAQYIMAALGKTTLKRLIRKAIFYDLPANEMPNRFC